MGMGGEWDWAGGTGAAWWLGRAKNGGAEEDRLKLGLCSFSFPLSPMAGQHV